jgi:hypothetical protein
MRTVTHPTERISLYRWRSVEPAYVSIWSRLRNTAVRARDQLHRLGAGGRSTDGDVSKELNRWVTLCVPA